MNIFVTGATGVLGKAVVPRLVAEGHDVSALSRSEVNRKLLQGFGVEPIQANLFEEESLQHALARCEAILHLATKIPPTTQMGRRSAWYENDRIRSVGTRTLVEAALAAGSVQTFIYPSFAFVYPDNGDRWIDAETTPVQPAVPACSTLEAEAEVTRFASHERRGISLRMGSLYGPEPNTGQFLRFARWGIAAYPVAHDAYLPQIWVEDAASALITALMQRVPSGVYDIVDDEPLTHGEVFAAMAQAVGRKHLWQPPAVLMRMMTGVVYDIISRSLRISNRRFKAVSKWNPSVPNARMGWSRLGEEST
jgi:nucleoside-diphosphate-sugar epimerase